MATLNPILAENAGKKIYVDDLTQEFIVSGYRLVLDQRLNRDTLLVTTPTSQNSAGTRGNIAFDNNHLYYCIDTNKWVRAKLANWDSTNYVSIPSTGLVSVNIPSPTHWWPFTSNGNSILGNYNFNSYNSPSFTTNGLVTNGSNYLLNCTSNIVEPTTLNENFSISFETKRTTNGFLMGCPFGKLGFHFGYVNRATRTARGDFSSAGSNLAFAFGTHNTNGYSYRWSSAASTSSISNSTFSQIVATNDATNKQVKIYVNGVLEETTSYGAPGTFYQNPMYLGFGIGASAQGICGVEYNATTLLKNMGFWKGTLLSQSNVTSLYNGGAFRSFPFV